MDNQSSVRPETRARHCRIARWVTLASMAAWPALGAAQGVRISGVTSTQYVELRQLHVDTSGMESAGERVSGAPFLQDLTFAAWGLGRGVSLHSNVRIRTDLGSGGYTWPRSDQHVDVLDLYAELDRPAWRGRVGRQWVMNGLGAYDFDGADFVLRRDRSSLEAWAGRALAAGLFETYTGPELAAVESRPPEQDGHVYGARARTRSAGGNALSVVYQRTAVAIDGGLYAERAAFDATTRMRGATLDAAGAYDFASGDWNELRLRLAAPDINGVNWWTEVRHSQPFFELWTIWGAFAPVGFDEARLALDARITSLSLALGVRGGYRRYGESHAGPELRDDGWRVGADARYSPSGPFTMSASTDVDAGFGAARWDVRGRVDWNGESGTLIGVQGSALQNMYEFRVGTGRVFGLAANVVLPVARDVRLAVDAGVYRHELYKGAIGPDWTQRRAAARLEWTLGSEPGASKVKAP